jgi:hypothetical protein
MPFDLHAYARLRPYLYHLTASANLQEIQRARRLFAASSLMERASRSELAESRRSAHVPLQFGGAVALLRDQAPLHARNMRLDDGWSFGAFVRFLNARVFFWPGNESGPIAHGQRHFARYAPEQPVVIRVGLEALLAANPDRIPLFSKYKSGSPRWSGGVASPRGATTFVHADQVAFGASAVVEVTFLEEIILPNDAEQRTSADSPWHSL